ncbi:DUF397 domain-containing protein [Streptomyces tremellae]|uniref:DUF397 domain-containing protein n=1 Tax=Streptomyces tremellae TaxID=1124239 RepID=A0ABP7FW39_9ACTN
MKRYSEPVPATGPAWVKSSYSGTNNNCVEVAVLPRGGRAVRDSKDPQGPALAFAPGAFDAFIGAVVR